MRRLTRKTEILNCESKDGEMCTSRDYIGNQYKNECHHCCYGCKHAREMTCSHVCAAVVEYYCLEEE